MYDVFLIAEAEDDILDIYRYVAAYDSVANAATLFENIQKTITSLEQQPTRGHIPPELARIDVREFLEIHYKPYRIIFQIIKNDVYVHGVLDGRRELFTLLQRRLLRISK